MQLVEELLAKLAELDRCPDTRAIVIAARGKAFCAGADIKELAEITSYAQVRCLPCAVCVLCNAAASALVLGSCD